jgi:hypothetical protein
MGFLLLGRLLPDLQERRSALQQCPRSHVVSTAASGVSNINKQEKALVAVSEFRAEEPMCGP